MRIEATSEDEADQTVDQGIAVALPCKLWAYSAKFTFTISSKLLNDIVMLAAWSHPKH